MTMTLDASQQQRFAPPLNFDYPHHGPPPTFSNPWSSTTSPPQSAPAPGNPLFVGSQHQPGMNMMPGKGPAGRASTSSASSMASYGSLPVATTGAGMATTYTCLCIYRYTCILGELVSSFGISNTMSRLIDFEPYADYICCLW